MHWPLRPIKFLLSYTGPQDLTESITCHVQELSKISVRHGSKSKKHPLVPQRLASPWQPSVVGSVWKCVTPLPCLFHGPLLCQGQQLSCGHQQVALFAGVAARSGCWSAQTELKVWWDNNNNYIFYVAPQQQLYELLALYNSTNVKEDTSVCY